MGGTLRIGRGINPSNSQTELDSASLIDLLSAVQRYTVSLLHVAPHRGLGPVGTGLSGELFQSIADIVTSLAFKNSIPSQARYDNEEIQDWYYLVTEIAILQHPPIKANRFITKLLGISWEYGELDGKGYAWPQTVTKKVNLGDLDSFLQQETLKHETRIQFCAQIIHAVKVLHASGIGHGDIKPKNVLVDNDQNGNFECRLIDFGGSAVVGQERLPQYTIPWNAPEIILHSGQQTCVPAETIIAADLYSLGLLLAHILIPTALLVSAELCLLELSKRSQSPETIRKLRDIQDQGNLAQTIFAIGENGSLPLPNLELLHTVLSTLLQSNPDMRCLTGEKISLLLNEFISISDIPLQPLQPPLMALSSMKLAPCIHEVFELATMLEDIDDIDYILRKDIAEDMQRKAGLSTCEKCKQKYASQLAQYYKIGFGVPRNLEKSRNFQKQAHWSDEDTDEALKSLGDNYRVSGRLSHSFRQSLGVEVLVTADLFLQYQFQGRLRAAEESIVQEIAARELEFGKSSLSLAKLKTDQAQIYRAQGRLWEAEAIQCTTISIYEEWFGEHDVYTLSAKSLLALNIAQQGFYLKAEKIQREIQLALETFLSESNPHVLTALHNLGLTLHGQGRYEEAADIFRKASASWTSTIGEYHPLTIRSEIDLATVLHSQGLLNEADKMMAHLFQKCSRIGDPLNLAQITMNLAGFYAEEERLQEAQKTALKALKLLKGQLGEDDPMTLDGLEILAIIHGEKGELKRQEELLQESIRRKQALDQRIPSLLDSKLRLAQNFIDQGLLQESSSEAESVLSMLGEDLTVSPQKFLLGRDIIASCMFLTGKRQQAEAVRRKLLVSFKESLGEYHPMTLQAMHSSGIFYVDQGRFDEAEILLSKALQSFRDVGRLYGFAIVIARQLALTYKEQNRFDESIALCEDAIEWCVQAVGKEHKETLSVKNVLAATYFQMGRFERAEELWSTLAQSTTNKRLEMYVISNLAELKTQLGNTQEAKQLHEKAIEVVLSWKGKEHPDTIKAKGNLLSFRVNNERLTQSLEKELLENIRHKVEIFGPAHPTTVKTMTDLAYAWVAVGDLEEAQKLFEAIEELGPRMSLQNELRYATYLAKRAEMYYKLGKLEETEKLERQALDIRIRLLEEDSSAILKSMANLASTLCAQRKYSDAEQYITHVIAVREARLGGEATLTLNAKNDLAAVLFYQHRLKEAVELYSEILEASKRKGDAENIRYREEQLRTAQDKLQALTVDSED